MIDVFIVQLVDVDNFDSKQGISVLFMTVFGNFNYFVYNINTKKQNYYIDEIKY